MSISRTVAAIVQTRVGKRHFVVSSRSSSSSRRRLSVAAWLLWLASVVGMGWAVGGKATPEIGSDLGGLFDRRTRVET